MMQSFIQTVRGRISPDALKITLPHEHLTADWPWALGETRDRSETLAVLNFVIDRLRACRDAGITCLVDVGPESFAPSPLFMFAVSAAAGVDIVCSTGVYAEHRVPPPGWVHPPATPETIAQRFIAAATDGILGSGVKPGIIKVGTSKQAITATEERVLRGAALAQKATGLAITTHTERGAWAEKQADIFESAGADLSRVVIGHITGSKQAEPEHVHRQLARRGVMIGLDLIGTRDLSLDDFADVAIDLISLGAERQILFSQDATAAPRGMFESFGIGSVDRSYLTIVQKFLPILRARGVEQATIDTIMIDNPRRLLTIDPARYPGATQTLCKEEPFDPFAPYSYEWDWASYRR